MSHTTYESDDGVLSKDQAESALAEEGSCGGSGNGGVVLKKGPWTSAEDAILIEYVKKHGEGNWNAVQKHSGLSRCGKSCRLRWANHLRPNLKKGAFTQEEEQLIIELHAKMGNKWARMAAHLPGRTDNEIKNYWNTRIKRRQRAGLPLYPPEVSLQALQESQRGLNISGINTGDKGAVESSPRNSGLLDALLHEAKTLSSAKNHSSEKSSNSSTVTPGCNVKSELTDQAWSPEREKETTNRLDITRPDALLASDWLEQGSGYIKDQVIITDNIVTLLGDDLSSDYKQMSAGASTSNQGWGLSSCAWNNMPAVCQMSVPVPA
ncbi:hypothetical protein GH714_017933 [Hevea brasiliensis]|uniref:Uncharacterized protein n=1 Tax=Hevea brasiliensis TaxID=3981 RepID=A0A6A6LMN0_HEVBR|nr:hypothetical protein GH714_017933 [Hevea brasiliensis]